MSLNKYLVYDTYYGKSLHETIDEATKKAKRRAAEARNNIEEVGIYQLIKKAEVPVPEITITDVA